MLSSSRSLPLAAALCAAVIVHAACGGNVIVDPQGAGGEGGTSVTTGPTTTSVTTTTVTTTTTTTTTTTSTGPGGCDNNPNGCGDISFGCIGCSVEGPCAVVYETCVGGTDCIDFVNCIDSCGDQACFDDCAMSFPAGAQQYNDLVVCVICEACFNDCDGFGAGCP